MTLRNSAKYAGIITAGLMALALAAPVAQAAPIVAGSQLDFYGGVDPIGATNVYDPTDTGVDFRTAGVSSPGTPGSLGLTNTLGVTINSFSGFTPLTCPVSTAGGCGTIKDLLSFTQATNTLINPALPVTDFLTFTQGSLMVAFDLTSFLTTQAQPTANNLGQLTLSGAGTLEMAGLDDTPGIVTITMQGPGNTSFSGSVVAQALPVPEPASILLLGAGLIALGAAQRKRASIIKAIGGGLAA
jgi:hypothetical protein